MGQHMLTPPDLGWIDPRKSAGGTSIADEQSRTVSGTNAFTANAGGTTTTIVGANAAPATETNVVRISDKFKLYTSAGVRKEETVFEVTTIAVAGSTTVTFAPAAAVVTASGDTFRLTTGNWYEDNDSLDERLNTISSTTYSQAILDRMTQNDKVFALRMNDDPTSF